jgi:hypothetical protein
VFVSRSSVDIFPIEKIWIPGVLQAANFVFLLCQAYWNFVPYVYIIFPIIFWEVRAPLFLHRAHAHARARTRTHATTPPHMR